MEGLIRLVVPGNCRYTLVVRTALSGICMIAGLDMDSMDDLTMASDEVMDILLHQSREVQNVILESSLSDEGLRLTFTACWGVEPNCGEGPDVALSRTILEALAAEVSITADENGIVCIVLTHTLARPERGE